MVSVNGHNILMATFISKAKIADEAKICVSGVVSFPFTTELK